MTESQLQYSILDLAKTLRLLVHHCRPAKVRADKWVIAGVGGVVFAELKNDTTQPTPEQMTWLGTLEAGGAETYLWRPRDWDDKTIETVLKRIAKPREVA